MSTCAFNHKKLESLFSKKQTPHIHAHHPHHAYAHFARHDHPHTHVHSRVYTCTHCGRKGHLAKFCYDKINVLNFANKKIRFLTMLTLKDRKENGYQNPHLVFLM